MSNMPRARRTLSRLARQITNLSLALNDIQEEIEECMSADLKRSKDPKVDEDLPGLISEETMNSIDEINKIPIPES